MGNYKSASAQLQNRWQLQSNTVEDAMYITINRVIRGLFTRLVVIDIALLKVCYVVIASCLVIAYSLIYN